MLTSTTKWGGLAEGTLGFTFCQVPVIYTLAAQPPAVTATMEDGQVQSYQGDMLPSDVASEVFSRSGRVARIDVVVPVQGILD